MGLTFVRLVAAAGTFASGGHQHTYATFHTAGPRVIAACGRTALADREVPRGADLTSCIFCTNATTSANVCANGGETPKGEGKS